MRKVILFLLVFISAKVNAQVYQEMPQYGYRANRMAFDSTLQIPTVCGVPTLKSVVKTNKNGAIAYDSCNARFYAYNPKTLTWTAITSGSADTTSLSNRINLKIDSLKRSNDSVYARKNGSFVFQFKDSLGINGTGSQYYVPKFSNSTTLQNSQIFDSVNVGINTTTPAYKLDVKGTTRIKGFRLNDTIFKVDDSLSNELLRVKYDGTTIRGTTDVLRIEGSGGTQAIIGNSAFQSPLNIYKYGGGALNFKADNNNDIAFDYSFNNLQQSTSTASAMINLGGLYNNQQSFQFSNLLISPTYNFDSTNVTSSAIARGIYYNPTIPLNGLRSAKHIAFQSNSGNVVMKGLKRSNSTTDSIAIWINDTLSKAPYPSATSGVPYTGATQDVDLGAFKISAQSFQVEGTNGLGHIHFKHQNSDATATGQSTVLYANSNGDLKYKNAGNYYSTLKTQQSADRVYTFQNKSYTLADSSDLSAKLNATDTASLSNRINLKLNIADTSTMLSKYLRKTDTASLSNRIDLKLNIADTSTMLSKYLRKTDTASLSNRIDLKLNIADTSTMLSKYLRKTDTATLSNRINLKLNISDTSTLQPKSISAYTILANKTSATANVTAQAFRDTSGVYDGTITWTGTTAPSGATNHTYRLTQVGKCVTINISLLYATNGLAISKLTATLPSNAPTPVQPTGLTSALQNIYVANGQYITSTNTTANTILRSTLRNNTSNNGFEFLIEGVSNTVAQVNIICQYWTN